MRCDSQSRASWRVHQQPHTTKSEGLVLLLCDYLSFTSEMQAIVCDCHKGKYTPAQTATLITTCDYVTTAGIPQMKLIQPHSSDNNPSIFAVRYAACVR